MSEQNGPKRSESRLRLEAILLALLFAGLGIWVFAFGSRRWLPELASRHGAGIDAMLNYLMTTTGTLLLIGHLLLAFFVFKFARSGPISHRLSSARIERGWGLALGLVIAVVAEGGVLAIGLPVFHEYFIADPETTPIEIEITGEQFAWNVRYPGPDGVFGRTDSALIGVTNPLGIDPTDPAGEDDLLELNNIYVVVDQPVRLTLRSKDVIHSLFLPHFRVKQDAVPGMKVPIWFVPTLEGRYEIACAELCGLAHYRMQGFIHVLTADAYDNWMKERIAEEA